MFKSIVEKLKKIKYFINTRLPWLKKASDTVGNFTSNKNVLNIAMILCATVFLIALYNIGIWLYENQKAGTLKDNLIGMGNENKDENLIPASENEEAEVDINKIKFLTTDINELQKLNPDTVAWLKVMGTKVDYPVVQTTDNEYYLTHDFNKSETKAGWVFGDFRCDFNNLGLNNIIYGHERMDYSMFGSLTYCVKDWWYNKKANHFVFLNTKNQKTVWQIFSIYVTTVDFNYIKTGFSDKYDFGSFTDSLNSRNQVPTLKADATGDDQVITLSTCYNISKRLVIHAKLVKSEYINSNEVPSSSSSSYNSSYQWNIISSSESSAISGSSSISSSSNTTSVSSSASGSSSGNNSSSGSSSSKSSSSESSSSESSSSETSSSESSSSESSASESSSPDSSASDSSSSNITSSDG